jgi:hypothetical protein
LLLQVGRWAITEAARRGDKGEWENGKMTVGE